MDFSKYKTSELLSFHCGINEELRNRGILRSANNPTGDLSEHLFCKAFGWEQAANSVKGYDAIGQNGERYQIKGRRVHKRNKSRQLSSIRNIDKNQFDVLASVIFDDDYNVILAALIPHKLVESQVRYRAHTNSNLFFFRDSVMEKEGVVDVTAQIQFALSEL